MQQNFRKVKPNNEMATLNEDRIKKREKLKIKLCLIATGIQLILSPLIASVLDQILRQIKQINFDMNINWNYVAAVQRCISDERVRVLWFVIQLIWVAIIIYMSVSAKPSIGSVDQMKITDDIYIPVPAGNGQHGAERFLKESEKKELFATFEFTGTEQLKGKGGIVIQMTKVKNKEIILYLPDDIHTLMIGATRCGKTRRVLLITLALQILSGISVVASDVKGELYYYTSPFAIENGYKTYALDFRNPEKSIHYNFLQPIIDAVAENDTAKAVDYTWDLVSVLVGQQKGEPLWYNGETATIAAGVLIIVYDAPKEYQNLTNTYYFLANMCSPDQFGNMPINTYLENLPETHPAKGVFKMASIAPFKTRSSFFTSALGTLRLFTNPNVAEMTSRSDINLEDIGKEKSIVYMMVPDEKKTLYPLISILVTQIYQLQVKVASENGLRLPVDTDYDLDEVGNFPMIPVLGNIVSAGASRGVRANLIIQDYQQLESKYKDDFKNIKSNCQCKLYLKSDDNDTLKTISDSLGSYTVEVSSASTSSQDGKKTNVNYSSSASLTGRKLLEPAELKRMKSPYALCMLTGEFAGINMLPDLSKYRFNELYGLGDEEHNNRIIMEREKQRKRNPVGELKLWEIWKEFEIPEEESEAAESNRDKSMPTIVKPVDRISFL